MTRPRKPAPMPFSPAAAKLIELIQADARATLLQDLSAKDGVIVLHGFDAKSKRLSDYQYSIEISDDIGNSVDFYRRYKEPDSWQGCPQMAGHWHPAYWYGHQSFIDSNGARWNRDLGILVCDDFGNLVQVAA